MSSTRIEWADKVWNPVTGCTPVSEGCRHCYAARMAKRLAGRCGYPADEPFRVTLHPKRLGEPLQWEKSSRIFVCSMGDLFHKDLAPKDIFRVFHFMARCPHHTFLVLTKRPERMRKLMPDIRHNLVDRLQHVWLGISIEDQATADKRIPLLLQAPATKRFISVEPMLGPVNLEMALDAFHAVDPMLCRNKPPIDWVICGGETGPGARPMHPDWVRSLRDQCQAAGVPFFFKGWGEWQVASVENGHRGGLMPNTNERYTWVGINGRTQNPSGHGLDKAYAMARVGKKTAGHMLDDREWLEIPARQNTPGAADF